MVSIQNRERKAHRVIDSGGVVFHDFSVSGLGSIRVIRGNQEAVRALLLQALIDCESRSLAKNARGN